MKEKITLRKRNRIVPVFFAADDAYVKFMVVAMKSVIDNASRKYEYRMHVLHTDISSENQALVKQMETANCKIDFVDVTSRLKSIEKKISLRDYYTATTYYRLFIPEMFPKYDKVVYIDGDTIVREDIANLYHADLGNNYIGAVRDQLVVQTDTYGDYVEYFKTVY